MSSLSQERERRSNVRRTNVTACARCRSRKQRCDQNIPACSNCERAGAECISTDIDGRVAPRSYIKSLEDRVAFLETQLASRELLDMRSSPGDFLSANSHLEDSLRDPVDEVALHSLKNNTFSNSIVSPDGQSLLRSLLAEPIRSVSESTRRDHRSLLDELPYEARAGFPGPDAATHLIDAYVRLHLWAMVERYPAGRVYRDAFEVLANSVLKSAETSAGGMLPPGLSSLGQDPAAFADIDLPQTAVDTLYWGFGLLS